MYQECVNKRVFDNVDVSNLELIISLGKRIETMQHIYTLRLIKFSSNPNEFLQFFFQIFSDKFI